MNISPCKGCEEREPGCHTNCMAYKKWHAEDIKQKEKLKQDKKASLAMECRIRRQLWK